MTGFLGNLLTIKNRKYHYWRGFKAACIIFIPIIIFMMIVIFNLINNLQTENIECVNGVSHEIPRCLPPLELLEKVY